MTVNEPTQTPEEAIASAPWNPAGYPGFVAELTAILKRDPFERASGLTTVLARMQVVIEWVSQKRDDAVWGMRQEGASYDQVAARLKISKSRASQICRRLEKDRG